MIRILQLVMPCALLAACATFGSVRTADVEVLETGYLVSNNVLTSPAELKAFLAGQDVKQVRLLLPARTPSARVADTNAAMRDAGVVVVEVVPTARVK